VRFALGQFQGGRQGGRTDEVILAVLTAPADDLEFGLIGHSKRRGRRRANNSYIASY
jgi:hypothetical protein